ncbi:MAG: non-homologous end joining protein Ku, partial [Bacillota bacterium]
TFGLVFIPVKLYAATEHKDLKFHYLHEPCKTPVQYRKFCPTCQREVDREEIVWGYEYAKSQYVVLREEDFHRIPVPTTKVVDILDFVALVEIDPIYFDKTYFLEPAEGGLKAYALLRRTMEETGRIAIAKVAIRTKESLAAIRVYHDRVLAMNTMFWPDEIREWADLEGLQPVEAPVVENEMKMAKTLVDTLAGHFEPGKYTDQYRRALLEAIHAKIEGREVFVAAEPEAAKVMDLMEALRASVRLAEEQRAGGPPRPGEPGGPAQQVGLPPAPEAGLPPGPEPGGGPH